MIVKKTDLKREVRKLLWKLGFDICRFEPNSHALARRRKLLKTFAIDTVLDVGANVGQFALQTRNIGFTGEIISFEPILSAYEILTRRARRDPKWQTKHCGLGDIDGEQQISIAQNSYSSSFLQMLPTHLTLAPESKYIARELTQVRRLDSIFDEICPAGRNIYLKIDTQGYESKVIAGADRSLKQICCIHLEMSLIPLYQDALLFGDMNQLLDMKGYRLVSLEPGFCDNASGQLLQVDGIYYRS
jgi:FkbM family methyltransferase